MTGMKFEIEFVENGFVLTFVDEEREETRFVFSDLRGVLEFVLYQLVGAEWPDDIEEIMKEVRR